MSKEYKALSSLFPVTLVGLIASIVLYEAQYAPGYAPTMTTSVIEFCIYLAGIFSISIEACKAASNNDAKVISDQIASLLFGIVVLLFYVVTGFQLYSQDSITLIPRKYEAILNYRPFLFSCLVVWLDVFNGFIIARFNRSR